MTIIKASNKVQQPAFNVTAQAKAVVKATERFDKASAEFSDAVRAAFQHIVDTAVTAGVSKDQQGCEHLRRTIKDAAPFREAVAIGMLEQKTVTEYAQSAMRAFFHGVPFSQGLKNPPEFALPWGKAKASGDTAKAGGVTSTTREALDATACKLLQQARLLGLNELAADMLDLLIERLDGFKESAE